VDRKAHALNTSSLSDRTATATLVFSRGETDMGDKGSKDKNKREQQKKAQRTPKEKRRLRREKKNAQ
jgi:hypothetical protein